MNVSGLALLARLWNAVLATSAVAVAIHYRAPWGRGALQGDRARARRSGGFYANSPRYKGGTDYAGGRARPSTSSG